MYWGEPMGNILTKHGIAPDFSFSVLGNMNMGKTMYPGVGIDYIHRKVDSDEVYFLSNQHSAAKTIKASFRVSGKVPELWFPDTGEIRALKPLQAKGEHTEIELQLGPDEAYFVVFRDPAVATAKKTAPWSKPELELADLSAAARDGKLTAAQIQGGCFTISSLGGIGGTAFTPIVNAPEVAILGVSRSSMAPVYDGENFVPRLMLPLSLSYDHRVVDGADAARFTNYLGEAMANATKLIQAIP